MAVADVQGALFAGANSFLTGQGLAATAISWPNIKFNPANKPVWAAVHFVPNELIPITAGGQGQDRGTGFLQIDIAVPVDTGDSVLRTWENAAQAYFPAGKKFVQNGQNVMLTRFATSQIRMVDNWAKKSFTLTYRFEINRPAIT